MSIAAQQIQASPASRYMAEVAGIAADVGNEDWQAGGALPDVLHDLKREGHISDGLYVAGCRLVHDMTRYHGSSAGITARYGDQVDGAGAGWVPGRQRTDYDAFQRMERVLGSMREHERALLTFCVLSRELHRGSLADWGRQHSRYATAKTARAFSTGAMVALLHTVDELYRGYHYHPG